MGLEQSNSSHMLPFLKRERWEGIRQRYESWWERTLAPPVLPIVRITAPNPTFPMHASQPASTNPQALREWFTDPAIVLPRLERQVASTYYAGDAFPWIDPLSQGLAAIQTAFLGAPYRIDPVSLSGWTEPRFDDWKTRPQFGFDPENSWWQACHSLLHEGARRSMDRYVISIPDLQGGGEILALLRGSEQLALDLFDCPEQIAPALEEINRSWLAYYQACYKIIHQYQPGYVDWLGIWSEKPAVTVECDFSVMVSPRMFQRFFLPALAQQVEWIARTVYHLDGPGQIPHLEAILDLSRLRAIQWIPTPDRPAILDWIPLLQRIQAAGKGVVVACEPDEILPLLDTLNPYELILTTSCASAFEAEELLGTVQNRFARNST
jgi:5-methyltetrahydrofolate--homocysteine methyltransferase